MNPIAAHLASYRVRPGTIAAVADYGSIAALRAEVASGEVLRHRGVSLRRCNELRAAFGLAPWASVPASRGFLSPAAWRVVRSYESEESLRADAAAGRLVTKAGVGAATEEEIKAWLGMI